MSPVMVCRSHEPRDGVSQQAVMSPVMVCFAVTGGHEPRDGVLAVTGMSPVMVCSQ